MLVLNLEHSTCLTKEHHTNILFHINQTTQSHASLAIYKMMRMNLLHHDVNRNHYILYIIHYQPYLFRRLMINNFGHSVKAQFKGHSHLLFIIDYLVIINCCWPYLLCFVFGLGVAEAGYLRHFICRTP